MLQLISKVSLTLEANWGTVSLESLTGVGVEMLGHSIPANRATQIIVMENGLKVPAEFRPHLLLRHDLGKSRDFRGSQRTAGV